MYCKCHKDKSDKTTFIIYADFESLMEKIHECKNNPGKSSTAKVSKHITSAFSMSTVSSFKNIENKHVYRGKDCMKRFCGFLGEHALEIIDFKKVKMKLLTNKKQQKSYKNAKICYICKGKIEEEYAKNKKYRKVMEYCHYTCEYRRAAHNICNLKYIVPTKIPIVFHNSSNYGYHFIIKELAKEFETKFTFLGKNAEKYITFSAPIEKEVTRIDKKGNKSQKPYLTDQNLLIAQDLRQAHNQILLIILLK